MIEPMASYLVTAPDAEIDFEEALDRFRAGDFSADLTSENSGEFYDRRVWIALPFESVAAQGSDPMRKVIGIGGIFVRLPLVYLDCEGDPPREILASQTREGGSLSARYFTYVRSQSFEINAGQSCLALINVASSDRPNIGIFREGELGTRQIIAVLLKGVLTATLLIIGLALAMVSYLTSRPLGVLIGVTYSLTMIQSEASVFTTTFVSNPLEAREAWEDLTLLTIFAMLSVFLSGFKTFLKIENWPLRTAVAAVLLMPLVVLARGSNSTPELIWAFYLCLFLFVITIILRFPTAAALRVVAGLILFVSAIGSALVEPLFLGRELTDLTIEWFRDANRLIAGLGMFLLLFFDVLYTRRERKRMLGERIEALETQARTDRRLLETEREYSRAREAATRTKAQLAAASHDIRQPIFGLRAAVNSEAERLSPALQDRLGQAINYLEDLTREYSDHETNPLSNDVEAQPELYSLELVTNAVSNMFDSEAREARIDLTVDQTASQTRIPALVLMRSISNLVANALRHAKATRIEVSITEEAGECRVQVIDDGVGMDSNTLNKVQKAGEKSDGSHGDGLGLAIVHALADQHGLDFSIVSAPREGTRATITFETETSNLR